jgi:hypothetical protein
VGVSHDSGINPKFIKKMKSIVVNIYKAEEWAEFAEAAHLAVFKENRPNEMNRIDFALLAVEDGVPLGYGAFREADHQMVYMQYGGAFPSSYGTPKAWYSYSAIVDKLKEIGYKYATTLIENDNMRMMKMAFKKGFRIIGVRNFEGKILCELLNSFHLEQAEARCD